MRIVCAQNRGAKNLRATETKTVAGDRRRKTRVMPQRKNVIPVADEIRALVTVYEGWLRREGYDGESHYPNNLLRLVRLGADLHDPESVKRAIGEADVKKGTKLQYVYAYDAFCRMAKLKWEPPTYSQEETIPFVPEEEDLDCLVAACRSRVLATYLQGLKETFGDPSEVLRIEREDVQGNVVTINHPVKGHLPRQIEVSDRFVAMLNSLPNRGKCYFTYSYSTLWSCYDKVRRRAAEVHKNPVLLQVELRSFRHWAGTMLAILTNGNVTIVQGLLGHKRVENTMKYIDLANVRSKGVNDECDVATASTPEETRNLLGAGFQMVGDKFGLLWFTRPKRFRGLKHLEDKRRNAMINLK
jgi:integrase